jgi:poly-gamma-glutamate synthesis protein (capsule biosynthesis protein)
MEVLFHPSIDSIFQHCDYIVANLECPATSIKEPINKKYIFRANPEWLKDLKEQGITHLNMANNHSMDQGRKGLLDTEANILRSGMVPLGFGMNIEQSCKPELIAIYPRKIYLISSSQVPSENWTYFEDKPCICEEPITSLAERIIKLKQSEAGSLILVQLHWGNEHTLVPSVSQRQQARTLVDAGADCIIGHHTHTIQTMELYKNAPIFYSIGNFIFDQSGSINTEGLMVKLLVTKTSMIIDTFRFTIKDCIPMIKQTDNSI